MVTKILALDLGTRCGWALAEGNGEGEIVRIDSGEWDLSGGRYEGGGMRFLRFRQFIRDVLPMADRVAYEEVRHHLGVDAAHVYGGLQATLTEECEMQQIPYESIPVGTIKKYACGKGNANKDMMLARAQELWPDIEIAGHDQADALHIARYVISQRESPF